MLKVRFLLFVILLFATAKLFAQSGSVGWVKGRLVDEESGKLIPYAKLALVDQDNEGIVIKATQTNTLGEFEFKNVPLGYYSLIITHVGFDKAIVADVEPDADNPVFNTGTIRLKKRTAIMREVIITDKKRVVTFDADQITYNMAQSFLAVGSNATDVLNNVPLVSMGIDGVPTIAGKRNTRIFIDGEPSDYMTANITDLLDVLPSDAIDKIEVLLNPPAKYSSDGDGIINIILKKDHKFGLNGVTSVSAGTLGNFSGNGYLSNKQKKLLFTSSYGFADNPVTYNSSNTQRFFSDTGFYRNQYINSHSIGFGHNLSEMLSWTIDSTRTLKLSSNYNFNRNIGQSLGDYRFLNYKQIQSSANTQTGNNYSHTFNYNINLGYRWKIKRSRGQLDASFALNGSTSPVSRFMMVNYQDAAGQPIANRLPFEQTYSLINSYSGMQAKADYEQPIRNTKSAIAYGISADVRTNNNNQDVENINIKTNVYTRVASQSNIFNYQQGIYACYGSGVIRTNHGWMFRGEARAEIAYVNYTLQVVNQPAAKTQFINPYLHIFPNASITKRVRNLYTIGLSYSGHTARPNNVALNPSVASPDSNNVTFRNLNITPSYTQQADLSFSTANEKWSFYTRIGYSYTNNMIERIISVDRPGRAQYQYDNLGPSTYNTITIYGDYRPAHHIIINGGSTIGQVFYQPSAYLANSHTAYSHYYKLGLQLTLPYAIAFDGNFNYTTLSFAQSYTNGPATNSFALRKSFYHNKMLVRFVATNLFGQSNTDATVLGTNFAWQNLGVVDTRNFAVSFSYNFLSTGSKAK